MSILENPFATPTVGMMSQGTLFFDFLLENCGFYAKLDLTCSTERHFHEIIFPYDLSCPRSRTHGILDWTLSFRKLGSCNIYLFICRIDLSDSGRFHSKSRFQCSQVFPRKIIKIDKSPSCVAARSFPSTPKNHRPYGANATVVAFGRLPQARAI